MTESDLIAATPTPGTVESIATQLRDLGLRPGSVVCVHSSLSRLGWVCGGAVAVVDALRQVLGPEGTLVVPTHTSGLTDPGGWRNPPVPQDWWPLIRGTMPPFRAESTPSVNMGVVAELIRTSPGARRSDHPHTSFAALGPAADRITDGHALDHMLGEGSPLARLYELDAEVLLLGVGYDRNTSLHLAEYRSGVRPATVETSPVERDGLGEWARWDDIEIDESFLTRVGTDFEAESDRVHIGPVGTGVGRLMSQRRLVDFAVSWLRGSTT